MQITEQQYNQALETLTASKQKQLTWLESVGFEFDSDVGEYFGVFISTDDIAFEVRDEVHIYVLQDDGFIDDARVAELENGAKANEDEIDRYVSLRIKEMRDGEAHPWIFWGSLDCGEDKLFVLADKVGYSFEGVDTNFIGIFRSLDEAAETAFGDGTLYTE